MVQQSSAGKQARSRPLSIVLIEDHDATREIFKAVLESGGHDVVAARDGIAGLEAVRENHPSVVITDIAMPGMDGIQVVRTLAADETMKGIPVIAATAQSSGYDQSELQRLFTAVLRKPVSPGELLDTIDKVSDAL